MRCNGDSRIIYIINYIFVGEGVCALPILFIAIATSFTVGDIHECPDLSAIVIKTAITRLPPSSKH